MNEGNPDDDELDTIREDSSAHSDSGESETEVDEVWTGDLSPRTLNRKTVIKQENQENYRLFIINHLLYQAHDNVPNILNNNVPKILSRGCTSGCSKTHGAKQKI